MKAIRHFSESNTWIDFVVLVEDEYVEQARLAVILGMNDFWEDSDICFGDAVERRLAEKKIPHSIVYYDESLPDSMWESYLDYVREKVGLEVVY